MTEAKTLQARMDALETRIAYQDLAIEDLNAAVTAQWAKIDTLLRQLASMDDRLQEAEARAGTGAPQQKPPHY